MSARSVAFETVRRVSEGAYADRAFRAEADRAALSPQDRAFAQQLAYGTVQRRGTLDHVIAALASRPLDKLDPPLLDALRLGVYQLLYMGSVPDHAAVGETVEIAKRGGRSGAGLVNAVLRRATREGRALVDAIGDDTPAAAALLHSHPLWIAQMWWELLGAEDARALLAAGNERPDPAFRVNTLVAGRDDIGSVPTDPDAEIPEALVPRGGGFDVEGSDLFAQGKITPQSRASMLVARTLDPHPGERILDMCAAPGTKTTHIAALMGDDGLIVAVERNPARAASLRENCERMHVQSVEVIVEDARVVDGQYDRVLLDAPCSNLGTLARRPDARWRKTPEQVAELALLQRELLVNAAARVRPGGRLVYSVCTVSPQEGPGQLDAFLADHPHMVERSRRQTLPHRDGTDGLFIAALERS
jgi:16S rRNA (cytosine967-C5)-methyltransferase